MGSQDNLCSSMACFPCSLKVRAASNEISLPWCWFQMITVFHLAIVESAMKRWHRSIAMASRSMRVFKSTPQLWAPCMWTPPNRFSRRLSPLSIKRTGKFGFIKSDKKRHAWPWPGYQRRVGSTWRNIHSVGIRSGLYENIQQDIPFVQWEIGWDWQMVLSLCGLDFWWVEEL